MVLFTYYVVLTFESMNKSSSAVLYIVVLYLVCSSNFESVDEILHSGVTIQRKTSSAVLLHGAISLVCSSNF